MRHRGPERESKKRETGSPVSALIAGGLRLPGSGCGSGSSGACTPPVPLPSPSPVFLPLAGLCEQAIGSAHSRAQALSRVGRLRANRGIDRSHLLSKTGLPDRDHTCSLFVSSSRPLNDVPSPTDFVEVRPAPVDKKIPPAHPTGSWKPVELV
jgi:hypothetical protein